MRPSNLSSLCKICRLNSLSIALAPETSIIENISVQGHFIDFWVGPNFVNFGLRVIEKLSAAAFVQWIKKP